MKKKKTTRLLFYRCWVSREAQHTEICLLVLRLADSARDVQLFIQGSMPSLSWTYGESGLE